ncbi:hypothetical protein EPA93_44470 [Ktedonosporobacter rubrisoli]|uniref:Uncharacterized protein n=1 Tax=Ktedonosporobacter rubrisoli TaxID=2509675 RepID=A0A4P6K4A0_KTERU|nr:hypothetical protein [Ktedonosporobacter rubrisoli]QBD82650.1 hypothetical protein EPA93_44470 [Ktedonosporobacter rubrisoli]
MNDATLSYQCLSLHGFPILVSPPSDGGEEGENIGVMPQASGVSPQIPGQGRVLHHPILKNWKALFLIPRGSCAVKARALLLYAHILLQFTLTPLAV